MPTRRNPGPGDRRRPGRPRRTPEQQAAAQERRIPRSQKGRLKFRPGDPHALDVQIQEARNYRRLIAAKLAQLQAALSALDTQEDPSAAISDQEAALKSFLWTTYQEHKHREHILATFLAIRRARLLAKLEAAGAALEMAADLLKPDNSLLQELHAAVEHQRQAAARQRQRTPKPPQEEGQQSQAAALVRITGADEETVRAQLDAIQAERDQEEADDPTSRIDQRHIYGDVNTARAHLAAFDRQIKTMRAAISPGVGWFEEFYIEKVQLTREARKYIMRGEKPPEDVPTFEGLIYGPYLKYRWQEMTGGPQYTIQMGLIPEGEGSAQGDEESGGAPWPNL